MVDQSAEVRKLFFEDRQHHGPQQEGVGAHGVELLEVALGQGLALLIGEPVAAGLFGFVEHWPLFLFPPGDKRIGVVVSGNLSLDVGGPLQFEPKPMDEEFDDQAVGWISRGDIDTAIRECTFDRMTGAGNVTHAFVNFLLAMGIARGFRCSYADGMKRKGSTQPFFAWEP